MLRGEDDRHLESPRVDHGSPLDFSRCSLRLLHCSDGRRSRTMPRRMRFWTPSQLPPISRAAGCSRSTGAYGTNSRTSPRRSKTTWPVSASNRCPPRRALSVFGRLLNAGELKNGGCDRLDRALAGICKACSPLSRADRTADANSLTEPASTTRFMQRLEAVAPDDRLEMLEDQVRREVARVLERDQAQAIDPRQGFFEMGMDSLTSLQLRCALEAGVEGRFRRLSRSISRRSQR